MNQVLDARSRYTLINRILMYAFVVILIASAVCSVGAFAQSLTRKSRQTAPKTASPPVMTKLNEYLVIVPLPDGRLMGVVWISKGEPEAAARYSTDNGYSWTEPQTLFKFPKEPPGGWSAHVGMLDQKGEIHIFYQNDAGTSTAPKLEDRRYDVWHTQTVNGRTKWQPIKRIWKGYAGSMLSVTQMRNGRIILPICYLSTPVRSWGKRGEGFDAFSYMGTFSSTVLYSDDGNDWHQSKVEFKAPTATIGADGLLEPGVIQLKDGRVWLLIRTQLGRFLESFSRDGANWSPPRPTDIISSDSPGNLIRLKTGQLVMFWNNSLRFSYANGGRHVLHAAISDDEGKTWRGFREAARNPFLGEPPPPNGDHGVTYTVVNVTPDGKVITPLSTGKADGTYLLHLDPAWLYETKRKSDFSAGFNDWSTFGTKGVEVVPNPKASGAPLLSLRKPDSAWPAGAVWNFPAGKKGSLSLKLLLKPGFRGASIGLTDHFSVPFDLEDVIFNLFNLDIGPNGELANGKRIEPGRWHRLKFDWDATRHQCRVLLEGREIEVLPLTRMTSSGVSYIRLRSTAESTDDSGLLIESVETDTSASW
jgi:hypothetical protein